MSHLTPSGKCTVFKFLFSAIVLYYSIDLVMIFDADETDNDRTMTATDLAVETDADIRQKFDVILAATEESGRKGISDCDARQANIDRIMQKCRSTSSTSENSGNVRGSGETCQSVPETVRSSLTDSTNSYSWSSSLPNGSRLETLSSNTVAKSETESVERGVAAECCDNVLSPTSCGSSQTAADGSRMTVGSGDVADDVSQQDATGSKRSSSRSLHVGDFLPSRGDASETTFGSPRVSLIERRRRPRNIDGCSFDESRQDLDRTLTIVTPSQPAASIGSRITSTPANDSNQLGNGPAANGQLGPRATCHPPAHARSCSDSDVGSLRLISSLDATANASSVLDSQLCLSVGPVEATVTNTLSQLPIPPVSHQNISNLSAASMSSVVDRVTGSGVVSFAGRVPDSAQRSSASGLSVNTSAVRISRKLATGRSSHLYC